MTACTRKLFEVIKSSIDSCKECPYLMTHFSIYSNGWQYMCQLRWFTDKPNLLQIDVEDFPEWCPL